MSSGNYLFLLKPSVNLVRCLLQDSALWPFIPFLLVVFAISVGCQSKKPTAPLTIFIGNYVWSVSNLEVNGKTGSSKQQGATVMIALLIFATTLLKSTCHKFLQSGPAILHPWDQILVYPSGKVILRHPSTILFYLAEAPEKP